MSRSQFSFIFPPQQQRFSLLQTEQSECAAISKEEVGLSLLEQLQKLRERCQKLQSKAMSIRKPKQRRRFFIEDWSDLNDSLLEIWTKTIQNIIENNISRKKFWQVYRKKFLLESQLIDVLQILYKAKNKMRKKQNHVRSNILTQQQTPQSKKKRVATSKNKSTDIKVLRTSKDSERGKGSRPASLKKVEKEVPKKSKVYKNNKTISSGIGSFKIVYNTRNCPLNSSQFKIQKKYNNISVYKTPEPNRRD